ncbi:uncharacterized protein LOC131211019 isoform X1 [Anopheles bellator]|uniref:uncharacterized protein LOC131211019 isoform X1 n=1 Tax=Anopheles bellator TaxID=139047 RepID=UPI002648AC3A|nr:uncharacterized protein LOC131211019 isoform X1 [Anopheles bellator]
MGESCLKSSNFALAVHLVSSAAYSATVLNYYRYKFDGPVQVKQKLAGIRRILFSMIRRMCAYNAGRCRMVGTCAETKYNAHSNGQISQRSGSAPEEVRCKRANQWYSENTRQNPNNFHSNTGS